MPSADATLWVLRNFSAPLLPNTLVVSARTCVTALPVLAASVTICEATPVYGAIPATTAPMFSLRSPIASATCFALPASVLASASFMLPTLSVTICASKAARSISSAFSRAFFCASENEIPTRVRAFVCPCITLPKRLPIVTQSCSVTLSPFFCAARLFIAGIRDSSASFWVRNVAICCAPAS